MDDEHGRGMGGSAAEDLILRTVAAHAESLLRTARRHSICPDDAQDAYQRALEIFMTHAGRLDPERAAAWLHVVVKREAQAIRRSRQKHVASSDVDYDSHRASSVPTPDEQLLSFDLVSRSAEALQRLKPQELRALWLKAEGHSYNEIGAITGWSYTKVNRCLVEGRKSFLERYASIESGAECERWAPVISAMVDGEAAPAQVLELRPHLRNCPGCRAMLKALQDTSAPLSAVLPIPLVVAATGGDAEHLSNLFMRAYEALVGGVHERAVHSATKVQAAIEAAAAGKVAAVAASAAAVAGGGYATVERTVRHERAPVVYKAAQRHPNLSRVQRVAKKPRAIRRVSPPARSAPRRGTASRVDEFGRSPSHTVVPTASEFGSSKPIRTISAAVVDAPQASRPQPGAHSTAAPEFVSFSGLDEFGP